MQAHDPRAVGAQRKHGHLVQNLTRRVGGAPPLAYELGGVLLAGDQVTDLADRCEFAPGKEEIKILIKLQSGIKDLKMFRFQ